MANRLTQIKIILDHLGLRLGGVGIPSINLESLNPRTGSLLRHRLSSSYRSQSPPRNMSRSNRYYRRSGRGRHEAG